MEIQQTAAKAYVTTSMIKEQTTDEMENKIKTIQQLRKDFEDNYNYLVDKIENIRMCGIDYIQIITSVDKIGGIFSEGLTTRDNRIIELEQELEIEKEKNGNDELIGVLRNISYAIELVANK